MRITLVTTGRRSRRERAVTLYGWPDGDRLVVVGSAGGDDQDPAWVLNLRADPSATVRRGRRDEAVRAREATDAEHARLWTLVTQAFPLYATYQRRTARPIPLFILEPAGSDEPVTG